MASGNCVCYTKLLAYSNKPVAEISLVTTQADKQIKLYLMSRIWYNQKRETAKATNRNNDSTIAETDVLVNIPVIHSVTVNYASSLQGFGDILFFPLCLYVGLSVGLSVHNKRMSAL